MEDTLHNPSFFLRKNGCVTKVIHLSTCAAPDATNYYESFRLLHKLGGRATFTVQNKSWIRTTIATPTSFKRHMVEWNIPDEQLKFIDSPLFSHGIIRYFDAEKSIMLFLYELNKNIRITYQDIIKELSKIQRNFKKDYNELF